MQPSHHLTFYICTQRTSLTHSRGYREDSNQYSPCKGNNLTTRHTWAMKATRVATFHDDYQRVRTKSYLTPVPSSRWKPHRVVRGWPEHYLFYHPWSEVRYHPTQRPSSYYVSGGISARMRQYTTQSLLQGAQQTWSLIDTGGGYHLQSSEYHVAHSHSFPSSILHFPLLASLGLVEDNQNPSLT
jgi:hypothetical protein